MVCEAAAELHVFSFPLTLKISEFAFTYLLLNTYLLFIIHIFIYSSFLLFIKITLLEGLHMSFMFHTQINVKEITLL